jgi:hypothetical protein
VLAVGRSTTGQRHARLREIVHDNFVAPNVTTTEQVGRAMIKVARDGYPKPVLESEDIAAV